LQSWNFDDPFSVELDDAFIGPCYLAAFAVGDLETTHFDFAFVFLTAEVFVGFKVAGYGKFVVRNVGDVLLDDNLLDFV
jgi:hypothetical protein